MSRPTVWAVWGVSRFVLVALLVVGESASISDVNYYATSLRDLGRDGVDGTLAEYPTPAFLALAAPYLLLDLVGAAGSYQLVVVLLMVVLDGCFLQALVCRPGAGPAVLAWLSATPALGALCYARFDLLPGILVGLVLLSLVRSPRRAAVLAALATGVKYSPALILPGLAAPARTRGRVLSAGIVTGLVLVVVSLVVGGWGRIVSPLTYQGERGLQIEAITATPAMVAWAVSPDDYRVFFSRYLASEVEGPGVGALLAISTVMTVLLLAALVVLWVRAWRRMGDPSSALPALVWLALAAISAFMVTSKVFSPQYLLWLLPPACAGLALVDGPARRRLTRWTVVLLLVAALTHVLYPHTYRQLLDHSSGSGAVVAVLAVRNLLLLGLCLSALAAAADAIRRVPRRPTDPAATPASG